eukprot:gb/GECG01009403.1/.p1 GENE.gb/GECG01009403.1/~~gb/GECG01009403.1/.p1  ORF type:complete len:438 (+),score=38.00 gb/GECG01009403.1/:1-1314(+)
MSTTLTNDEINAVIVTASVVSTLSMIGSGFIIFCYFHYKHLRNFAFTLVLVLSFNDFFNQITIFLTPDAKDLNSMRDPGSKITPLCAAQATMESFFELSSILWTSAIAATLYMSVFMRLPATRIRSSFKYMVLVCQGIPLVLTAVPGALGKFGPAGAWCWINKDEQGWRWGQFFAPLWLAIIFNAVVYIMIIRKIKGFHRVTAAVDEESAQAMLNIVKRLRFYPLILVVVWIMATVNRIVEEAKNEEVYALFFLQKIFSSTQGLLNAFAYGFSSGVREAIRDSISKQCPSLVKDVYARELVGGSEVRRNNSRRPLKTPPTGGASGDADDDDSFGSPRWPSDSDSGRWDSISEDQNASGAREQEEPRKNTDVAVEMSDRSSSSHSNKSGNKSRRTDISETINPVGPTSTGYEHTQGSTSSEPKRAERVQSLREQYQGV